MFQWHFLVVKDEVLYLARDSVQQILEPAQCCLAGMGGSHSKETFSTRSGGPNYGPPNIRYQSLEHVNVTLNGNKDFPNVCKLKIWDKDILDHGDPKVND